LLEREIKVRGIAKTYLLFVHNTAAAIFITTLVC